MKEHPILFSAPMVLAILDGRKTMTRRIVLSHKLADFSKLQSGDILWVREAYQALTEFDKCKPSAIPQDAANIIYTADRPDMPWDSRKRPAMFMPRWASRITLRVTDVHIERLQEISEDDAKAEGILKLHGGNEDQWCNYPLGETGGGWAEPRNSFKSLWESIHGPGSWQDNPWVAAISFEKVTQ